jgi:hypothetical protein
MRVGRVPISAARAFAADASSAATKSLAARTSGGLYPPPPFGATSSSF